MSIPKYNRPDALMYTGISEEKKWSEKHRCYLRIRDCELAEKYLGYTWWPIGNKTDYGGVAFTHMLTNKKPDLVIMGRYFEPDVHVPNSSTNLRDALKLARVIELKSLPILETDRKMAEYINEKL